MRDREESGFGCDLRHCFRGNGSDVVDVERPYRARYEGRIVNFEAIRKAKAEYQRKRKEPILEMEGPFEWINGYAI